MVPESRHTRTVITGIAGQKQLGHRGGHRPATYSMVAPQVREVAPPVVLVAREVGRVFNFSIFNFQLFNNKPVKQQTKSKRIANEQQTNSKQRANKEQTRSERRANEEQT